LLEFDGVFWRTIKIPGNSVRSIVIDDIGIIYVGGKNEIGYLTPDTKGTLQYRSLTNHLEEDQRDFGNVWGTYATKEGIYFQTSLYLFRWNSKKLKVWEPEPECRFNTSFSCEGKLFVHQRKVGLMHVVDDSLELVPRDETFAGVKIYMMVLFEPGNQKLLIGTRSNGFYIYDGNTTIPFPTDADNYLKERQLYHGIRLSSGDFALATRLGGLVIVDKHGRLKNIFNKTYGLQDDSVKYVFEDFQGNLWLGLNEGISKIEYISPISVYDNRSGLENMVLSVKRHHDVLYVGGYKGLYSFESNGRYRLVPGMSSTCWSILSTGKSLLVATSHGVYQLGNNTKREIISNSSYMLVRSHVDPNRIWVGTKRGLTSLYQEPVNKNSQWKKECKFEDITEEIRTIVEEQNGILWLGTTVKSV
jgi:ligand-binding sensor domain-containing protein